MYFEGQAFRIILRAMKKGEKKKKKAVIAT
jgi:hypothetical protein